MLPLLLSGASDKTDTLRQRSVVGVTLALFLWDPAVLDKHIDGICRMIKARTEHTHHTDPQAGQTG